MKKPIEIDDTLQDRVNDAIDSVRDELLAYLDQNPDTSETPCLNNDLDYSGAIHEIIDGSVPIYTSEIKPAWFLYGCELEQAYDDAGVGHNPLENDGMAAIYFYIQQKVAEWYDNNAEDIFSEWREKQDAKEAAESDE